MSAVKIAVTTAVVGVYSANRASKAATTAANAQRDSTQALTAQADRAAELSYSLGQQQLGLSREQLGLSREQLGLGREQLDFSRQQYAEFAPIAKRAADQQFEAQEEQMAQARDYYDYQTNTFRPVEKGLVADALSFDTEAYREQLASQAAADAARAFGTAQGMSNRDLARRGVDPSSGASRALSNQNTVALASMQTGAATGARERAQQLGYARKLDAAGLGRNLPGLSTAAYQSATGAGSAGVNSYMAPGNQFTTGVGQAANIFGQAANTYGQGANIFGQGANTIMAGSNQAMQAYGQLYGGANTAALNAQNNYMGVLGGMVGMGGNVAAAKFGLG